MNTAEKEIFNKMVAKASLLSVNELKKQINQDTIKPVLPTIVFDCLMDALKSKVTEEEFITFCDSV